MPSHELVILSFDEELSYSQIFGKEKTYRQRWCNWYGNHSSEPLKFFVPGNGNVKDFESTRDRWHTYDYEGLKETCELVKAAEKRGRKVRAVGSGHALTAISQCEDYIVCTHDLNLTQRRPVQFIKKEFVDGFEVTVNFRNEKATEKHFLFETGGGTKVHHLITALEKDGLALMNKGGSSIQAISGAIATSTHGSGIGIGPLPSMVRSVTIVGKGGQPFRIEPHDGITDADLFNAGPEVQTHGIQLIQDDDVFNSALVGIGSMGIVFSLILEVQESYRLYEERKLWDWETLKKEMLKGNLYEYVNAHRHFEVLINPYIDKNGPDDDDAERKCLVTSRDYSRSCKVPSNATKQRNYISSFVSGISISGRLSPWVFNRNSKAIPRLTNNSLTRLIDHAEKGGGFEGDSYRVLDQGLGELKFYGYAIEIGFEMDRVFEAVDLIFKVCEEAQFYEHHLAAPFSLRFVKQCPAYLSMMNKADMCMIELVSVKGVTGTISLLMRLERELLGIGGVPHWGLSLLPWTGETVQKAFPDFKRWKKNQALYAGETFTNSFVKNILD
ncbi:D-arabinono-1,4-lactone oxidase [Negadavirga shengliensis]|uniref:D-arabinono-1,4-lactone oxidase n=1 Tax=Negadavirga shengliensis TaxID=1389218 RepID=A0ABV9SZZ3_9BACT